ncbi:hypothetical protein PoMZ_02384, partial [Pyricularia oryzae]
MKESTCAPKKTPIEAWERYLTPFRRPRPEYPPQQPFFARTGQVQGPRGGKKGDGTRDFSPCQFKRLIPLGATLSQIADQINPFACLTRQWSWKRAGSGRWETEAREP